MTADRKAGKVPESQDLAEENRRIRYLRILTDLTHQRLCVERMTFDEAWKTLEELRMAAGRLFPGKQSVFDLVIAPRLERVIRERFGAWNPPRYH
ncbi:MAG: hypothetical protein JSV00_06305 [bacterium]|nr:MAG: hypothetical protein JSV00_06305 [bacterium]